MRPNRTFVKVAFPVLLAVLMLQIPFLHFFFEPYPSLTLPQGTSIIRTDSTIDFETQALYVEDRQGRMQAVSREQVLPSLPVSYRFRVLNARFGLRKDARRTSPQDAQEVRTWLRERLEEADGVAGNPRALHVRRFEITLDLHPGKTRVDTALLSSTRIGLAP